MKKILLVLLGLLLLPHPAFAWWNTSYSNATFSPVINPNSTVIYLNINNVTGINNATDVFGSFIFNKTTGTVNSTHFIKNNVTEIPFFTNSVSGNIANVSVNVSTIGAGDYVGIYSNGQTNYGDFSNFNKTFMGSSSYAGTTIDTHRWVVKGSTISQNNALLISGDTEWGGTGIYSVQNFTRPFVYITQFITNSSAPATDIGILNNGIGTSYTDYIYGLDFDSPGIRVSENGSRYTVGTFSANTNYWFMIDVSTTGAKYYNSTDNRITWNLMYSSTYSPAISPLKIGASQYLPVAQTRLNHTIVYNSTSPMPKWTGWGATQIPTRRYRVLSYSYTIG